VAVTINAKGTASPSFTIGKQGTTLHQGDAVLASVAAEGDFWFDSTNGSLQYKGSVPTVWRNLVFDDISFLDDSIISLTGDATIALSDDIFITPGTGGNVVVGDTSNASIVTDIGVSLSLVGDEGVTISTAASNADINLVPDGTGSVVIGTTGNQAIIETDAGDSLVITAGTDLILQGQIWPGADGTAGQVLSTNGSATTSWTTLPGIVTTTDPKTSAYTASPGERIPVNTLSSAITITLPLTPGVGDQVAFIDYLLTWNTNNLTVARNGQLIQNAASDLVVSSSSPFTLEYIDSTAGWRYV
jgi:hypothetical protein